MYWFVEMSVNNFNDGEQMPREVKRRTHLSKFMLLGLTALSLGCGTDTESASISGPPRASSSTILPTLALHNSTLANPQSPGKKHNQFLREMKQEMSAMRRANKGRRLRRSDMCVAFTSALRRNELANSPLLGSELARSIVAGKCSGSALEQPAPQRVADQFRQGNHRTGSSAVFTPVSYTPRSAIDAFDDSLAVLVAMPWHDSLASGPSLAEDTLMLASLATTISGHIAAASSAQDVATRMASVAASYGSCAECADLVAPVTAFAVETATYWEEEIESWDDDQCGGGGIQAVFSRISREMSECPPSEVSRRWKRELDWKGAADADLVGAIGFGLNDLRSMTNMFNMEYWSHLGKTKLADPDYWLHGMTRAEAPTGASPKVLAKFAGKILRRAHVGLWVLTAGVPSAYVLVH